MTYLIYALLAFFILIFFHELGHFIMAKLMGVRVLTFALGFGKKLVKVTWRGTEYAICAFPLGGYVKMMGEDPDEEVSQEESSDAFSTQSAWKRFIIVLAGPAFNLVLAVFIAWIFFWGEGESHLTTQIQVVQDGSPAAEAGLQPGDRIVAIDGQRLDRWQELWETVLLSDGSPMSVSFERQGTIRNVVISPRLDIETSELGDEIRRWRIGISPSSEVSVETFGPGRAFVRASQWTWEKSWFFLRTLGRLVQGKESFKQVGGPIFIGMMAGKSAQFGAASYFTFIAFLSIILAIMNLLPIPVLDGGHLAFFAIEALVGKPVNKSVRGVAQYVGIGILACIMTWAFIRDGVRVHYILKNKGSETPAREAPSEPALAPESQ